MTKAMYERSYGSRYNEPGNGFQRAADIAKLIRRDIKAAIAKGELPGSPKDYSVRSRSYSGGQAIDLVAKMDELWVQCPGHIKDKYGPGSGMYGCGDSWCKAGGEHKDHPSARYHKILSAEGRRIKALLQSFHDAYNHDGSEVMMDYFDRRYWGSADIERKW